MKNTSLKEKYCKRCSEIETSGILRQNIIRDFVLYDVSDNVSERNYWLGYVNGIEFCLDNEIRKEYNKIDILRLNDKKHNKKDEQSH